MAALTSCHTLRVQMTRTSGRVRSVAAVVVWALAAGPTAQAGDESGIALVDGEGVGQVRAMCTACHSLDYIQMNSPFQDAAGWDKTVTKMIKVMGAPISPEDSAVIVAYLSRHYGKEPAR